jgi:hypothetical protein
LFSRRPVHKHCSIYSKKYGSAIPHENRPEEQGRFRYCSPETTPPIGSLRPDFVPGSLRPRKTTSIFKVVPCKSEPPITKAGRDSGGKVTHPRTKIRITNHYM